jgi:hypothetical protein
MNRQLLINVGVLAAAVAIAGCGVYTFSGSTLPGYLKTVDIPLFGNQSLQPDVAEELTTELNTQILSSNLLRIVAADGDATIQGRVVGYTHNPYTYGAEGFRDVTVTQYAVSISVDVTFMDNRKNEPLYKGVVKGEGIYNLDSENEDTGRRRAIEEVIEQILQNSVQSW